MDQTGLRNVPYFMEPIDLLMCKHQAATEPYLKANVYKFWSDPPTQFFCRSCVKILYTVVTLNTTKFNIARFNVFPTEVTCALCAVL